MNLTRTVLAAAAIAALTACQLPTATSEPTTATDTGEARQQLAQLTVAPEDTGYHYGRDDWPHWTYVGDGCDVRALVLREQAEQVQVGPDCDLTGRWVSPYDGATVTDPSDLDIDHVVPLSEAADSGVRGWTEADRETFANDRRFLVAVTATSNRQKGDQDPAEWLPDHDRCGYATRWIAAKHTYHLHIDPAERDALDALLDRC